MKQISTIFILISIFIQPLPAQVIYVDASATGNADGTTWGNAYPKLQTALSSATPGDSIWVAAATYLPTETDDRTVYFELKDGVKLLGGFAGNETSVSERDWQANPSVLSGDIGIAGDSTDNSYTILYMRAPGPATLVDGFTFAGGVADDFGNICSPGSCGAAIYIDGQEAEAHPRVWNCRFEGNYAKNRGGAVFVDGSNDGSVAPQFYNCGFFANSAGKTGGAIERDGASWTGTDNDFWDCVFEGNTAGLYGGAVLYLESEGLDTIEFLGCKFIRNEAGVNGGGIAHFNGRSTGAKVAVKDCSFERNIASNLGGAVVFLPFNGLFVSYVSISGCMFKYNNGVLISAIEDSDHSASVRIDSSSFVLHGDIPEGPLTVEGFGHATLNMDNLTFADNASARICNLAILDQVNVKNCLFKDNRREESDLGLFIMDMESILRLKCINSLFLNNHIATEGLWRNSIPDEVGSAAYTVIGCVIKNRFFPNGNYIRNNANLYLSNSIIVEDSSQQDFLIFGVDTMIIEHSLITSSECPSFIPIPSESFYPPNVICGEGNLFGLDPLFADTASGDYHLLPCSPARNAGDNGIVSQLGITGDFDGQPRIQEGRVDMGAYEMPAYSVSVDTVVGVACHGGTGGFTASITSGCAPFTVEFSGSSSSEDGPVFTRSGLPAGVFTFVVKDSENRQDTFEVSIFQPSLIEVELSATPADCTEGTPGTATATASGGTGSLSYEWEDGMSGASVTGLPVGYQTVVVTDSLGCTFTDSVEVEMTGELALAAEATDETCFGFSDGTAAAVPAGVAPYAWSWAGGETDSLLTGLPPGSYMATVTDAIGCEAEVQAVVGGATAIMVSDTVVHATGAAANDGSIEILSVGGGVPDYSFLWDTGATAASINGLSPGDYMLTVTDANGCEAVFVFTVDIEVAVMERIGREVSAGVCPSPVAPGGTVWLLTESSGSLLLNLRLSDVRSSQLWSAKVQLLGGTERFPFEMPDVPGAYFLAVENGETGQAAVLRLVVQ
ncbi:MAG TPA: hypothetical protein ENJ95_09955 [Bacteroidetes bacterium]|nr:hypothetical protein [Bacteroidota bacterium]